MIRSALVSVLYVMCTYNCVYGVLIVTQTTSLQIIDEACQLFTDTITSDELRDCTVLILFNKIDIAPTDRKELITKHFMAHAESHLRGRIYHTTECCACTGVGLHEAFEWLATAMLNKPAPREVKVAPPTEKDRYVMNLMFACIFTI